MRTLQNKSTQRSLLLQQMQGSGNEAGIQKMKRIIRICPYCNSAWTRTGTDSWRKLGFEPISSDDIIDSTECGFKKEKHCDKWRKDHGTEEPNK